MNPTQAIAVLRSIPTHDAMQAEAVEMAVAGLRGYDYLRNRATTELYVQINRPGGVGRPRYCHGSELDAEIATLLAAIDAA